MLHVQHGMCARLCESVVQGVLRPQSTYKLRLSRAAPSPPPLPPPLESPPSPGCSASAGSAKDSGSGTVWETLL